MYLGHLPVRPGRPIVHLNEKGAQLMGYGTVAEVRAEKDLLRLRERLDQTYQYLTSRDSLWPPNKVLPPCADGRVRWRK
jgi:hypothetical protein